MIFIAHRGNTEGPSALENTARHIEAALDQGFDVEVDVRYIDGAYCLGHDYVTQQVPLNFLARKGVWVHAKDPDTFEHLASLGAHGVYSIIHTFYQRDDAISLTTRGYYWTHINNPVSSKHSIIMPTGTGSKIDTLCHGVCTDYAKAFRDLNGGEAISRLLPKLLLLDVDGVLTNGKKMYATDGNKSFKEFCDRDFTAIKRFQAAGMPVVLISGDSTNRHTVAFPRGLDMIDTHFKDKLEYLAGICRQYKVLPQDIMYVGDDMYDVGALSVVGYSYAPADCIPDVAQVATVLETKGGDGVVAELFSLWMSRLNLGYPTDSAAVNP